MIAEKKAEIAEEKAKLKEGAEQGALNGWGAVNKEQSKTSNHIKISCISVVPDFYIIIGTVPFLSVNLNAIPQYRHVLKPTEQTAPIPQDVSGVTL